MEERGEISFRPIGTVRNRFTRPVEGELIRQELSELKVFPEYRRGLTGAAPGQKILVVFHFHRAEDQPPLVQHPRGDRTRSPRGVFTLRSPDRPNGIGVTEVSIEAVTGEGLVVRGLDALDGSPLLDLKIVSMTGSETGAEA